MADSVAGVVLAAGAGTRLAPLTSLRPKALCPVGDRPLVDHAIAAVQPHVGGVAVNVHHGRDLMFEHLADRPVHLSIEDEQPLGTAGAIGQLAGWLDGRAVLVANADCWHRADLAVLLTDWSGDDIRILTSSPGDFGPGSTVVASLLPAGVAGRLPAEPSGLWEAVWHDEVAAGRLVTVHTTAEMVDCGTPRDYLRANLRWAELEGLGDSLAGVSVVGAGAEVYGRVERCVVWPGSIVDRHEVLVDAIRAEHLTVLVR